ncbi:hypothetical protein B0H15DRAFT_951067 [Mycena belliarum]|uniref:Uncharacterized protein n=1 Tax=Mycena belliarum TaxID=1033014 RepID=A0AAD6XT47_9AGAR|nr:hypothetical protein B0H15DRAFT_951067 [Mycena belliae]
MCLPSVYALAAIGFSPFPTAYGDLRATSFKQFPTSPHTSTASHRRVRATPVPKDMVTLRPPQRLAQDAAARKDPRRPSRMSGYRQTRVSSRAVTAGTPGTRPAALSTPLDAQLEPAAASALPLRPTVLCRCPRPTAPLPSIRATDVRAGPALVPHSFLSRQMHARPPAASVSPRPSRLCRRIAGAALARASGIRRPGGGRARLGGVRAVSPAPSKHACPTSVMRGALPAHSRAPAPMLTCFVGPRVPAHVRARLQVAPQTSGYRATAAVDAAPDMRPVPKCAPPLALRVHGFGPCPDPREVPRRTRSLNAPPSAPRPRPTARAVDSSLVAWAPHPRELKKYRGAPARRARTHLRHQDILRGPPLLASTGWAPARDKNQSVTVWSHVS